MKLIIFLLFCIVFLLKTTSSTPVKTKNGSKLECNLSQELVEEIANYTSVANRIIEAALGEYANVTYNTLAEFVDTFGPRMTGSQALDDSIDFLVKNLTAAGLENVHTEEASVPIWTR